MSTIRFNNNYFDYTIESTEAYVFDNSQPQKTSLDDLLNQNLFIPYNTPTPQANNINTVIDLTNFIAKNQLVDKLKITSFLGLNPRQTDYYINACRYLDLVTKNGSHFILTSIGERVANTVEYKLRNIVMSKQILKTPLFNEILRNFKENGHFNHEYVKERIMQHDDNINSAVTAHRRKSTILNWSNWVIKNIK